LGVLSILSLLARVEQRVLAKKRSSEICRRTSFGFSTLSCLRRNARRRGRSSASPDRRVHSATSVKMTHLKLTRHRSFLTKAATMSFLSYSGYIFFSLPSLSSKDLITALRIEKLSCQSHQISVIGIKRLKYNINRPMRWPHSIQLPRIQFSQSQGRNLRSHF
jgi:hypothetical protein